MVGKDFIYMGKRLSDFNCIMVKPNEDDVLALDRSVVGSEISVDKVEKKLYGVKYDTPLVLPMLIILNECNDKSMKITTKTMRELTKWLSSPTTYKPLRVEPYNDDIREYMGIFTSIKPYVVNGLNGLYLTFTCSSPFAYIPHQHILTLSNESVDLIAHNDTDEIESYTYPTFTFYGIGQGTLVIKDVTHDYAMSIQTNQSFSELYIDCQNRRIVGDGKPLKLSDLGYTKDDIKNNNGVFSFNWFRLQNGRHKINFCFLNQNKQENDIKIKMEYKTIIKTGGF